MRRRTSKLHWFERRQHTHWHLLCLQPKPTDWQQWDGTSDQWLGPWQAEIAHSYPSIGYAESYDYFCKTVPGFDLLLCN